MARNRGIVIGRREGVYHVNAIDEVMQFEIGCPIEKIGAHYLIPMPEALLEQFPLSFLGSNS